MPALLAALAMAASVSLKAQTNIANYRLAKSSSTYTPITGGTVVASGAYDNEVSGSVSLGGTFTFGGTAFTTCYVSANGYITFGAAPSASNYAPLSSLGSTTGAIAAYAQDAGGSAVSGASPEVSYLNVGGSTGEFVVQYKDHANYYATAAERMNFQIRLNLSDNSIKIVYGPCTLASTTTDGITAQAGLRGSTTTYSTNVNNLMIGNVPSGTTCNWSDAVTGNANSSTLLYSFSTNPSINIPNGLTYTWTPGTVAPVRAFGAVTNILANAATISWTAPTGATQYNIQYRALGTCAWTSHPGNPVTGTTATLTGLTAFTTYQVRVQSSDGTNNAIWSHIPNAAGTGNGYTTTGTFTTLATCGLPTAVTVPAASINSTQATVNWTAPTIGPPTGYKWEIRTSGAGGSGPTGLAATGSSTTTTATANTLTSATTYSVYVRTLCGASDSSGWTSAVTFTTLCTTPAPGATVASVSSGLCAGTNVAFSLAAATPGPGVTYQWQSSQDNVTYSNVSGATAATYTGPAAANYYRCMVKCAAGPDSTASTPVQLIYNNNVVSVTNNQRCGVGTVALQATGSTGATLSWYADQTSTTLLGTGSSFTTPTISTTTPFYVSAASPVPGTVTMGTGTSATSSTDYPNPLSAYYGGTKHQMLFLGSELQAQGLLAGNITSIAFDVSAVNTTATCNDFTIRMGTTNATALSGFVTGTVPVYNASFTPSVTGIVTFTLTTPFNWDGSSNIIVETVHNQGNTGNGSGTRTRYTTTSFNSVFARYADNVTPATAAGFDASTSTNTIASANRPNIVFGGQKACSSPRMKVTATVNAPPAFAITPNKTVCNNVATALTVTSNQSSFNNYTWSPATNLYTDANATVAYVAGASATTVYHKSATAATTVYTVTANNSTTQCTAVTTDTITVLPAAATAIATPSSICYSGTTTLALNPATGYGTATFRWQSSMNNIAFVDTNGTAATYTTPTLTSTRYYRAVIKNSDGAVCFNSTPDTALVNIPTVTGTTPGARCGPGVVNLSANVNPGATTAWFTSATSNVPVATGSTYAPNVTTTTNYWVAARMSGTGSGMGSTTIGNGTSTTTSTEELTAFCNRRQNYRMQIIFTGAELAAAGIPAGNLTSIGFNITDVGDAASNNNFVVKIGTTSQSSATATFITSGLNTVYGPSTYTHAVGQNTINFTTPFPWDGTANIVVEITHDGIDDIDNATTYYTTTTNSMTCFGYNTPTSATTSTKRFNTTFGHTLPCESPRQQVTATVNPLPTITVTPAGPVTICSGTSTTLTATGGGSYQWKNTAGNIGGQTNAAFTTGNAGTYKVVVTTPATGCIDSSAAITVNVSPIPSVNLGNDTTFCSGNTLTLDAGNAGATYLWNDNSTNQTKAVTSTGTYTVKVTNSSNCSKSDTIKVTVNPTPVVDLGNDTNLCLGVNYVLNAGNPGASFLWDNASTAQTRTVTSTGTYYVRVRNSFNCTARDTITATFLPTPVVNLGANRDICAGASVTLDAGNPGETYLWDDNSTNQTRTVNTTGTYHVTVSNIANCRGRDTVSVTVHPLPVVNLGNDTVFCHGNTLTLDAGNPGASYRWNDNSTNQTLIAGNTGTYSVVVTDGFGCVGTDAIDILVKDPPSGNINAVYSDNATYIFNVLNARYVSGYTWDFGDGSPRVTGATVQHQYAQNGIYTVTVLLSGECSDSLGKSRTVDVFDAAGGTGIPQVKDSKDLLLYPNPARDIVTLENKHNLKMKHITVYNVIGQTITDSEADSGDKHILHTQTYAPGVYTIRIETDKGTVIRKFEIMK